MIIVDNIWHLKKLRNILTFKEFTTAMIVKGWSTRL